MEDTKSIDNETDLDLGSTPFISGGALACWMEAHGACLTLTCIDGIYCALVEWCKLHYYSDERGMHKETWELSRAHRSPFVAIDRAFWAAVAQSAESEALARQKAER
jgi:hypothetical protein